MASKTKTLTLPQRLRKLADEMDAAATPPQQRTPEEIIASIVERATRPGAFKKLLKARRKRKAREAEDEDSGNEGEGAPPPSAPPQPRKRRRSTP